MEDPQDIAEEIFKSQAYLIQGRIEYLYSSYSIFDHNFQELKHLLEKFRGAEPKDPIWNIERRHELGALGQDALRLLHNFLASAKTFADVTRVLIQARYQGHPFADQYRQEAVSRFSTSQVARFVQDLRNYMLHYSLPITRAHLKIQMQPRPEGITLESSFILDREALLEWDRWTTPARAFLTESSSDLDILGFTRQYHSLVQSFHAWIQRRLSELHSTDLQWLQSMQEKLRAAQGGGQQ